MVEIFIGSFGENLFDLTATTWINYLAGVGSILLTFLAGAEVDPQVIRKHIRSSVGIGVAGFLIPFGGVLAYAHYVLGWSWPQAQIAGLSLSTTSVAVVYAVMVESRMNRTEIGKIILAACFINDLGTVLVLGILFANHNLWLILFAATTAAFMWLLPRFVPWFFRKTGNRISEPQTKFIFLFLFFLGGLCDIAKSEAILPAYSIGMILAPFFLQERVLAQRMRVMAFTLLTPFYFLKVGSLVRFETVVSAFELIFVFLGVKMTTKFIGILPLTRCFRFSRREGMYTTLMMCTGFTFGTIAALFGLNNGIIDQDQYTILVAAVIGSAVIPTLIAQRWFQPEITLLEEDSDAYENSTWIRWVGGIFQGSCRGRPAG